jgi:hypothetical protein
MAHGFAELRTAKYDLDGWVVPDLINADDGSIVGKPERSGVQGG